MKLKTKLALMSIAVSSVMCAAITISAVSGVESVTAAIAVTPAQSPNIAIEMEHIESADTEMQKIAATTVTATRAYNVERIYALVGIVVAGAFCTWLLAAKMLEPLEKLTEAVKAVNPENLFIIDNAPQTSDEVGRLGEAFSEMSVQIGQAYNLQKNFSASAAHELRTPLAVLSNEIDVFKLQKNHTDEEYSELVDGIRQSADRLSAIVEDLLCFTNQNSADTSMEISLKPIIEEIVDDLNTVAVKKNITIKIEGNDTKIFADDALIQRAFYNLIENALKYSPENTVVTVKLGCDSLSVIDNGCGIPDDEKEVIFQPFYRVDKSRSRNVGGSGLGLAIVKQIADKHGFTVTVSDLKPKGSIFKMNFK